RLLAHEHGVDDFVFLERHQRFQHGGLAALADQLHFHVAVTIQHHGLLAIVEVTVVHVRYVSARCLAPLAHAVRVLARIFLHGLGRATVGVALTQYRVDSAADAAAVALPNSYFFLRPWHRR